LALSKDKAGIIKLLKHGQIIAKPKDIIKDPYIFEFLEIPEEHRMTESKFGQRIIDHLQTFLLELGKGFSFAGRLLASKELKNDHSCFELERN